MRKNAQLESSLDFKNGYKLKTLFSFCACSIIGSIAYSYIAFTEKDASSLKLSETKQGNDNSTKRYASNV